LNYDEQIQIRNSLSDSEIYANFFKNDNPVLVFIGRLTNVKKLHLLIEAQRRLINSGFPVNLAIIGDGQEKSNLENMVKEYGLDEIVWFIGELYEERQIADYLFNAD